jgi:hypothetical protein
MVVAAAMFTAPSMSTTSRLVVPSTSMSPEISRLANTEVPVAVTVPETSRLALTLYKRSIKFNLVCCINI